MVSEERPVSIFSPEAVIIVFLLNCVKFNKSVWRNRKRSRSDAFIDACIDACIDAFIDACIDALST